MEIKKTIKITAEMDTHIKFLAEKMQVSENDVFKMLIFESMIKGIK